jgi:hypothetical protein
VEKYPYCFIKDSYTPPRACLLTYIAHEAVESTLSRKLHRGAKTKIK